MRQTIQALMTAIMLLACLSRPALCSDRESQGGSNLIAAGPTTPTLTPAQMQSPAPENRPAAAPLVSPSYTVPSSPKPVETLPPPTIPPEVTQTALPKDANQGAAPPAASEKKAGTTVEVNLRPPIPQQQPNGNLESFFDIQPEPQATAKKQRPESKAERSLSHRLYRLTWHVLDNIGIPMFFGFNDSDLDPSLAEGRGLPTDASVGKTNITDKTAKDKKDAQKGMVDGSTTGSTSEALPSLPKKIPASELEGTMFESGPAPIKPMEHAKTR